MLTQVKGPKLRFRIRKPSVSHDRIHMAYRSSREKCGLASLEVQFRIHPTVTNWVR